MKKKHFITDDAYRESYPVQFDSTEWINVGSEITLDPRIYVQDTTTERQIDKGELSLSISYEPYADFSIEELYNELYGSFSEEFGRELIGLPPKWKYDLSPKCDSDFIHYPWLNTHFHFKEDLWLPCSHPKIVFNSLFLYTRCSNKKCQAIKENICDGWNIPFTEKNHSNPCIYRVKR